MKIFTYDKVLENKIGYGPDSLSVDEIMKWSHIKVLYCMPFIWWNCIGIGIAFVLNIPFVLIFHITTPIMYLYDFIGGIILSYIGRKIWCIWAHNKYPQIVK